MNKEKDLVLKRLWKTLEMIVNLEDEELYYDNFVNRYKYRDGCGTQCCVAGWYPKYFPESKLKWKKGDFTGIVYLSVTGKVSKATPEQHFIYIEEALEKYHMLDNSILGFLFYGKNLNLQLRLTGDLYSVLKALVENGFERFIHKNYESVITIPKYHVKVASTVVKKEDYGSSYKKIDIQEAFELIYYLIENDYIIY